MSQVYQVPHSDVTKNFFAALHTFNIVPWYLKSNLRQESTGMLHLPLWLREEIGKSAELLLNIREITRALQILFDRAVICGDQPTIAAFVSDEENESRNPERQVRADLTKVNMTATDWQRIGRHFASYKIIWDFANYRHCNKWLLRDT